MPDQPPRLEPLGPRIVVSDVPDPGSGLWTPYNAGQGLKRGMVLDVSKDLPEVAADRLSPGDVVWYPESCAAPILRRADEPGSSTETVYVLAVECIHAREHGDG